MATDIVRDLVIEGLAHDLAWIEEEFTRAQWLLRGALVELETRRIAQDAMQRIINHQREQIRALAGVERPELDDEPSGCQEPIDPIVADSDDLSDASSSRQD